MKRISCYSYKGGTGRTTSMANISTALAELGKNVAMIDLDVEGAGLSVVLDAQNRVEAGIQDYLNSTGPEGFDFRRLVLDLKRSSEKDADSQWARLKGELFLVPARLGIEERSFVEPSDEDGERKGYEVVVDKLRPLFEHFRKDLDVDFVMIDSASGYGDLSVASMLLSDVILVFFRWSRQHLLSTVNVCEFFRTVWERDRRFTYELIANSVPALLYEDRYRAVFETARHYVESHTDKQILTALPENDEMKWRERVLLFDKAPDNKDIIQGFRSVANLLVERYGTT